LLVVASILVFGCSEEPNNPQGTVLSPEMTAILNDVTVVEGDFGTGALYALYCPADWNGDLVVYAHGYTWDWEGVHLPYIDDFRDGLLAMGYGVAYSSYSETGYAVKDGANNTRQLRGLYASAFGMPEKTYLTGHSMGGLITVLLAERNPQLYAGALPMCGIIGGTEMAFDYIYHLRVLFDYYYPGALPGDAQNVPPGLDMNTVINLAAAALTANPMPAFELAGVDPVQIQYADPNELFDAIIVGLIFHTGSFNDMFGRTHSHTFFDNSDVVYSGSADDAALNAGVGRFTATPDAEAYFDRWYEPRGKLRIPMLALHTSRDQVAQVFHVDRYAGIAAAEGNSGLFDQIIIDRYGHCEFTTEEQLNAFAELVAWSEDLEQKGMHKNK
jgi:pimeloyl-ACP methyl ester carboxylesterase